jgi:hypothetical protein
MKRRALDNSPANPVFSTLNDVDVKPSNPTRSAGVSPAARPQCDTSSRNSFIPEAAGPLE